MRIQIPLFCDGTPDIELEVEDTELPTPPTDARVNMMGGGFWPGGIWAETPNEIYDLKARGDEQLYWKRRAA